MELGLPLVQRHERERLARMVIGRFLEATKSSEEMHGFLGTMPMTLSKRHLQMIARSDYILLEKSDGVRYLLMVQEDATFLIDRRMSIYVVLPDPEICVPGKQGEWQRQNGTLLDGELTFNLKYNQWEYLIYDAVSINGDVSVAQWDYRRRMEAADRWFTMLRLVQPNVSGRLRLRVKDFYEKVNIKALFEHIGKSDDGHGEYIYTNHDRLDGTISNKNDGVIFAPVRMPYPLRTCEALLKWKPPHLNSVDFELRLERIEDPRTGPSVTPQLWYKGDRGVVRMRTVTWPSAQRREMRERFEEYDRKIVECSYDLGAGEWKFLRIRHDKSSPNYSTTVIDTLESIAENVKREDLVKAFARSSHNGAPPAKRQRLLNSAEPYVDDLFDKSNEKYVCTTPMSRVLPPCSRNPRVRR